MTQVNVRTPLKMVFVRPEEAQEWPREGRTIISAKKVEIFQGSRHFVSVSQTEKAPCSLLQVHFQKQPPPLMTFN